MHSLMLLDANAVNLNTVAEILLVIILLIIFKSSVKIAHGDEFITVERRWFGKQMPDGRTIALHDEVGMQARTLGPGFHLLIPFMFKATKNKIITVGTTEVGIVTAVSGLPIPDGSIFAEMVECNLFQDGEAFLRNKGQKGLQLTILPPGQHRINPALFKVEVRYAIVIGDDEIGVVEALAGKSCPQGRIFADPVACNDFMDASLFLRNGGQKGPQIPVIGPGIHRINTALFNVQRNPATVIPGGRIGLVTAMDGGRIPEGSLLARNVEGHSNFENGEQFIKNGGQKGRQLQVLMPGKYRINTMLFQITAITDWVHIDSSEEGIVTVLEGKPISENNTIAAEEIGLEVHDNFQNPSSYLDAGGQKGLQIPVLRAGNYAINPWFAEVRKEPMVDVEIGNCAVITSFVGKEGADVVDQSDAGVNAKIVTNGNKGIWATPYGAGKHALNIAVCKVDIVPTTQILLNWADDVTSAHKFDEKLCSISLRTADGFTAKMDVRVIVHIPMAKAPMVIANQGSVKNMISQVLEPAISSHFRNAAQSVKALDLLTRRAEIQQTAEEHIRAILNTHNIETKGVMIADIVLPPELVKTVSDRQMAEQEQITYKTQTMAQEERKKLSNATAQADMQKDVVTSERGVEISKNLADAAIKKSEGEGKAIEVLAESNAKAIKLKADADAELTAKVGKAEAEVIAAKGKSTADAYEAQNKAMGSAGSAFSTLKVMELVTNGKLKLIPDNLIMGGSGGSQGGMLENFMGVNLLKELTGKNPFQAGAHEVEESK